MLLYERIYMGKTSAHFCICSTLSLRSARPNQDQTWHLDTLGPLKRLALCGLALLPGRGGERLEIKVQNSQYRELKGKMLKAKLFLTPPPQTWGQMMVTCDPGGHNNRRCDIARRESESHLSVHICMPTQGCRPIKLKIGTRRSRLGQGVLTNLGYILGRRMETLPTWAWTAQSA